MPPRNLVDLRDLDHERDFAGFDARVRRNPSGDQSRALSAVSRVRGTVGRHLRRRVEYTKER